MNELLQELLSDVYMYYKEPTFNHYLFFIPKDGSSHQYFGLYSYDKFDEKTYYLYKRIKK